MRFFPVPFDIQKEDKIIGGKLSIRQLIWLAIPSITILFSFLINTGYLIKSANGIRINFLSLAIRIILSLVITIIGAIMAFVKINMQNADAYFLKLIKFYFRKKTYRYGR